MEFLKEILGDDLFKQIEEKINAHNGNEANKDKQIKIGNLGSGEYVGKGKYDSEIEKLNALISGKDTELQTANNLIADLQKATKGIEEIQGKITNYETVVVPQLQAQLQETKINGALKVALLSEKAIDVPYMTFKIMEKLKGEGKTLELDENENIKGWDDLVSGLKTQFPAQFEKASTVHVDPNPLPSGDPGNAEPKTLAEALQMQYETKQN